MTKFYTYWQGTNSPKYLHLCVASWFKYIPNLELTVISHDNLNQWVGDTYDIDNLKKYSLPIQSDAVSAAILARHGGVFIDCDTILTRNPVEFLQPAEGNAIKCFGMPASKAIHVAVLSVGAPQNPIAMRWMSEISARLDADTPGEGWDFLGGQILQPLIDSEEYTKFINIIDRTSSGNILESFYKIHEGRAKESYEALYFEAGLINLESALDSVRDGIISLHNSWTPKYYSKLDTYEAILEKECLLSEILYEASDKEIAKSIGEKYL